MAKNNKKSQVELKANEEEVEVVNWPVVGPLLIIMVIITVIAFYFAV
ncbi:hypothetical protein BH23BAC1_BH23BAC1_30860 [soil metagenome]